MLCICTVPGERLSVTLLTRWLEMTHKLVVAAELPEGSSQTHPCVLELSKGVGCDMRSVSPMILHCSEVLPDLCPLQVATKAGIYEILNQLGFSELESMEDQPLSGLRHRWQEQSQDPEPCDAGDFL